MEVFREQVKSITASGPCPSKNALAKRARPIQIYRVCGGGRRKIP